jgi:hypothetical protein
LPQEKIDVIFGVFRLIEKDDESYLAWAKEPYACIIFNLHVVHWAPVEGPLTSVFWPARKELRPLC